MLPLDIKARLKVMLSCVYYIAARSVCQALLRAGSFLFTVKKGTITRTEMSKMIDMFTDVEGLSPDGKISNATKE
jgi:hypothetical protein